MSLAACMQVHRSEADGAADGAMVSRPAKRCRFSLDGQEGELVAPAVEKYAMHALLDQIMVR